MQITDGRQYNTIQYNTDLRGNNKNRNIKASSLFFKNAHTDEFVKSKDKNVNKISFGIKLTNKQIACDDYLAFVNNRMNGLTGTILGEKFAPPISIRGISSDYDMYFHIYGLGDLHLMLMPKKNGLHNYVMDYTNNPKLTINNITELVKICNKNQNKSQQLYLFESGSSYKQSIENTKGIIPAHLHYILGDNINEDELLKTFEGMAGRKIIKLENITLDYLYKRLQNLTYSGFFGYKHISKQISPDRYNSYILIENNPNIPSKSQLQPRVLSKLFNGGSEDNEHYNWKILDTDSKNWTYIQKQHIEKNRKAYQDFYDKLKNANLVI